MPDQKGVGALLIIGTPLALIASLLFIVLLFGGGGSAAAACIGGTTEVSTELVPAEPVAGYSGEQLLNAAFIMNAATAMGLGRNAQVIGVMTAMGESSLQILDNGDTAGPDSRGLFQQRANGAWGSYDDRMDPTISATNFFEVLIAVEGWEEMQPSLAIHEVQVNADPWHYEKFFTPADAVVSALSGAVEGGCSSGSIVFPLAADFNMTDDYGPRVSPTDGASSWHPAVDLQHYPNPCGDPIASIGDGTVTAVVSYWVTVKSPEGYDVTYMHMKLSDVSVSVGDTVTPGQQIALVGSEGPSTGCHLDIRINKTGTTNTAVAALPDGVAQGGTAGTAGYVNPEDFFEIFGLELCGDGCSRNF